MLDILIKYRPSLDPGFIPAALWNKYYRARVASDPEAEFYAFKLVQHNGAATVFKSKILHHTPNNRKINIKYIERTLKFLLWHHGGNRVLVSGNPQITQALRALYSDNGARSFDNTFLGKKIFGGPIEFIEGEDHETFTPSAQGIMLGRHLKGNRIGFDLGGSDRKCAAVIDGEVVFSEEIEWNPYFQNDPDYHIQGIKDSLNRAAAHLPKVDAIGGSAAGVYVNNEVRASSLFRGLSHEQFDKTIRPLFIELKKEWNGIPFEVVNDGEITALAGSMSLNRNRVLGISMGTSQAAGYVNADGSITSWLNELAFAPIDYSEDAAIDEWSGDCGCGVQYFSQQAVARLCPAVGIDFEESTPLPARLVEIQNLMADGDERALAIYSTIGVYLGYSLAYYREFYDFTTLLLLGRVTSGSGCAVIIEKATEVLENEFPEIANTLEIVTPDEKNKRHGQAIAAASLPNLEK